MVPLAITGKFVAIGAGLVRDEATVRSMSRSGAPRELLYGPAQYGVVFSFATMFFWQSSACLVALMTLCFGDAAAEIVGKSMGRTRLPWSRRKTFVGSAAFFAASVASSAGFAPVLLPASAAVLPLPQLAAVCAIVTLAESLCPDNIDNLVIFAVSTAASSWLLT